MINLRLATRVLVVALSIAPTVRADLNVSSINAPVTITFDTAGVTDAGNDPFTGAGFQQSPTAGQLDSDSWAIQNNGSGSGGDMAFGGTETGGNFARGASTGGVTTGGIYSFDVDNDTNTVNRTLGVQAANNVFEGTTGGTITLRVKNTTGSTITAWSVAYDIYSFNDQTRSTAVNFSYSTTDTTGIGSSALYTSVAIGHSTTITADTAPVQWASTSKSTVILPSIANDGNLFLRWTITDSGSGSRDEIGLDNISVAAVVPEPSASWFGGLVCGVIGLGIGGRRLVAKLKGRG